MFQTVPLSIIRSFSLCTQKWYMSYRFADNLWAGSGRNWVASCMTYTTAVCTVKNSWWWTEELSETCGVLFQKYIFEKLVYLVCFIVRIYHDARSPECQKPVLWSGLQGCMYVCMFYVCLYVCKAVVIVWKALKFSFRRKDWVQICIGNNSVELSGFEWFRAYKRVWVKGVT